MVSILQVTFQFWLVATTVFVFVRLPSQSAVAHCRRSRFWHSCRCLRSFSRPFCFYSRSNNLFTLACFILSSAPLTSNPPAIAELVQSLRTNSAYHLLSFQLVRLIAFATAAAVLCILLPSSSATFSICHSPDTLPHLRLPSMDSHAGLITLRSGSL